MTESGNDESAPEIAAMSLILSRSFLYSAPGGGGALNITTTSLSDGTQGSAYSATLSATGGTPPYKWSLDSGTLNPGLLTKYTGSINGIVPVNAQADSITIKVTDAVAVTDTQALTLTVNSHAYDHNLTGTFDVARAVDDYRFYLANNRWSGGSGTWFGYGSRSMVAYMPYVNTSGSAEMNFGFPCINQGWHNDTSYTPGYLSTTPWMGGTAGPQISALTACVVYTRQRYPLKRGDTNEAALLDIYCHTVASPGGTDTGNDKPIFSLMIENHGTDTRTYWAGHIAAGSRYTVAGQQWILRASNENWAQAPTGGATNNTVRAYPAPWNDTKQWGPPSLKFDLKAMLDYFVTNASTFGITLTASHYLTSIQPGFEGGGGGPLFTVTAITKAASAVITINDSSTINPMRLNDLIKFASVGGMTEINGLVGKITALGGSASAWTATVNINSTSFTTYTSGGTADTRYFYIEDLQVQTKTASYTTEPAIAIHCVPELSENISRNLPVTASAANGSHTAAKALDADNTEYYRSNIGVPSTSNRVLFAINTASVDNAKKTAGLVHLSCEPSNAGYLVNPTYDLFGDLIIEGNATAFSGTTPPASGWQTLATMTGNLRTARTLSIGDWSAYGNALRVNVYGEAANNAVHDISMRVDVQHAPSVTGVPDGWISFTDSIGNKSLKPNDCEQGGRATYIGDMIANYTGHIPIWECGGISGWSTADLLPYINGTSGTWIDDFPGRYVFIAHGTNADANFVNNLTTIVNRALNLGKTVILPSCFYRKNDGGSPTNATARSTDITNVIASINNPRCIAGPDLNTIGNRLQSLMFDGGDDIHPGIYGQAIYRTIVADWVARVIYWGQPASTWVCPVSI